MSKRSHKRFDNSRRHFLLGSAAALATSVSVPSFASVHGTSTKGRQLSFHHTHTGENLHIDYHDGLTYIPDSLSEINHYLRDFRTGDTHPIDPHLLDILHHLKTISGRSSSFEVISGYRSPKTNAGLSNKSTGVAKRSLHMQGKAIDIRLSGYDTHLLHKANRQLARGGAGYYRRSDFIHVDTGRVRHW